MENRFTTTASSSMAPGTDSSSPLGEEKKVRELTSRGGAALKSGETQEALSYFQTALSISETLQNKPRLKLSCLLNAGAVLITIGEHQRGISLLQSALSLLDSIPNRQTETRTGDDPESRDQWSPDQIRGDIYFNLGLANGGLGEASLAATQLKQSIDYYMKAGSFVTAGDVFATIAMFERERSNHKEQVGCLLSAQRLYQDGGDQTKEIMVLTDLAIAYQTGGKREECVQALTRAKIMGLRLDEPKYQSQLYSRLGLVYSSLKMFPDAIQSFERALPLLRLTRDEERETQLQQEAALLQNIGAVYNEMGQYVEGLMYHKTAATLYSQTGQPVSEAKCLCNLALCQTHLKEYSAAHQSFTTALSLAQSESNHPLAFQALEGLGSLSYKRKDYETAGKYFKEGLELLGSMKGGETGLARERIMEKLSHVTEILQKGTELLEATDTATEGKGRHKSYPDTGSGRGSSPQLMPIPLTPRNTVRFSEDKTFSLSHRNPISPHGTTPTSHTPRPTNQIPASINEANNRSLLHSSTLTSLTATSDSSLLTSVFKEPSPAHPHRMLPTSPVVTQGSLALGPNTKALYTVEKQEVVQKKRGRIKSHQTTRIVPIASSSPAPLSDRAPSAPPTTSRSSVCSLL